MSDLNENIRKLRVGSRGSPLALRQVDQIFSLLAIRKTSVSYDPVVYATQGDKDTETSLTAGVADNFFTDAIDVALLTKEIDVAVHSAKDLPKDLPDGLKILALTAALDETDAFVGRTRIEDLPEGAKVGTSSPLRRKSLREHYSHLVPCDIRGTIEERIALTEEGKLDGIIVATCALKRVGLQDKIRNILPWEVVALQGQLAVVGRRGDLEMERLFSTIDVRRTYGPVTLVGAGPGDPDLITIKAVNALHKADCVFYDYLVDKELLKYASRAEKIYVGKRKGEHSLSQAELSRMLKDKALAGANVVRLKGGDPLIFGRGADEITYLRGYHIDVRIIPGVSSATGIPSLMGIPLTARGIASSVAFVSGHSGDAKDSETEFLDIPAADTLIFLMGLTRLRNIVDSLEKCGWAKTTPVVVISRGTRPDERIVSGTIGGIQDAVAQASLNPPALIIVGEVVRFWNGRTAQDGKILYLGTYPDKYRVLGNIVHLPVIEISKKEMTIEQVRAIGREFPYHEIIIFTSRFAVDFFEEILKAADTSLTRFKYIDIAAIGRETAAALEAHGVTPNIQPKEETSMGLLTTLIRRYRLKGKKILFPRSALPNPFLKEELIKLGADVTELTVYENRKTARKPFPSDTISKVIFTSPSTVRNFIEFYGVIPDHWKIFSRGPRTSEALKEAGYESEVLIYG